MEKYWYRQEGNDGLIVFALGWAADFHLVDHIRPPGYDILCLYDWRDLDPGNVKAEVFDNDYKHRFLFAWSFGVRQADKIFAGEYFDRAIAYNGTPYPADSELGIGLGKINATIRTLQTMGMDGFEKKSFGKHYDELKPFLSPRSVGDNIIELEILRDDAEKPYKAQLIWHRGVVATEDEIWPVENMYRYWGGLAERLPIPHYPFAISRIIEKEV